MGGISMVLSAALVVSLVRYALDSILLLAGIVMENVVPAPNWLLTVSVPLCASTIRFASYNPKPIPLEFFLIE